jgi:hypothetical protein
MKSLELWRRLERFEFDSNAPRLSFVGRLARENRWSSAYAARAADEYLKFIYLLMVCDEPLTPSDAVDEVWHLHLTYTRSYWRNLCSNVLGADLHHDPTRGGPLERRKYSRCYQRTLAVYEQEFGAAPPADIWPAPAERFRNVTAFARINTASQFILNKRRLCGRRSCACGLCVDVGLRQRFIGRNCGAGGLFNRVRRGRVGLGPRCALPRA